MSYEDLMARIAREIPELAGALSRLTPFKDSQWQKAMESSFTGRKAKLLDLNRKAFALGREAVAADS